MTILSFLRKRGSMGRGQSRCETENETAFLLGWGPFATTNNNQRINHSVTRTQPSTHTRSTHTHKKHNTQSSSHCLTVGLSVRSRYRTTYTARRLKQRFQETKRRGRVHPTDGIFLRFRFPNQAPARQVEQHTRWPNSDGEVPQA